jgi:hypothetical protein
MRTGGYLGLELKFLDTAWNNVALASTADASGGELQPSSGCTNAISVPAQGDGESNRDGRKYVLKSAFVSGVVDTAVLQTEGSAVDSLGYYFALVLDTQANGATVVSEEVYVNPGTSGASLVPQPLRNLQNSKRFRVLDSVYVPTGGVYAFNDGVGTGTIAQQNAPTFKLSWKGTISCDSTGTTADVASASDNAMHLVGFAASTAFAPRIFAKGRVRFMG